MKLDMRYGHHPEDVKHYDTETLRRHFLVEKVFVTGELTLTYTHVDRVVFGGATPTTQALALVGGKEFGTPNFLDRRELGVVNLGEPGRVIVDGTTYALANGDGLYVGMGTQAVSFESDDPAKPAKFYLISCPAHATYPTVHITRAMANPKKLGAPEGFTVVVRRLKVCAGAGFIVAYTGDILTMPGLPKVPAAENIDVDENGVISGLF